MVLPHALPPYRDAALSAQTDEDLLSAIERDPEGGIRQVLERYGPSLRGRLRTYARMKGYGDAEVDDVWLRSFMRLLDPECRAELRADGGQILPWLSKWGYWRIEDGARRRPGSLPATLRVPDPAETFETNAPPSQLVIALRRVFPQLPPRQRLILRLRYLEGLKERELADRLGITHGAAKKAAHDARESLKRRLIDEGINQD